jgi:hypothetical protein
VICSISGYGEDGPYAARKAYDMLVQAESGLASVTGGPEAPARVGVSVCDIAAGAVAHNSAIQNMAHRDQTAWFCRDLQQAFCTDVGQPPLEVYARAPRGRKAHDVKVTGTLILPS